MTDLVLGTAGNDTLTAPSGDGTDYKYDAKQGNDVVTGSTGNDLIIGGQGSDVLFGGAGADTFQFTKAALPGDKDFITDFHLGQDALQFGAGVSIVSAEGGNYGGTTFDGASLTNDAKTMDMKLTIQIDDGTKHFTQDIYLMDVLKNTGWSADQMDTYLHSLGFAGNVTFSSDHTLT